MKPQVAAALAFLLASCSKPAPPATAPTPSDTERSMAKCKIDAGAAGMDPGDIGWPDADYIVSCMKAAGFDLVGGTDCGPPHYNLGHASCYRPSTPISN